MRLKTYDVDVKDIPSLRCPRCGKGLDKSGFDIDATVTVRCTNQESAELQDGELLVNTETTEVYCLYCGRYGPLVWFMGV